ASTFFTVASSTPRRSVKGLRLGASETMAPTFKSRLAQPSRRLPIPGAKESSTVVWQKAHWMPIDVMRPALSNLPVTPTTAFNLSRARVVAGSSRSTLPALICATSAAGKASVSTLRPTDSAVFGLTPPPTPPFFSPAMALCNCKAPPQKASEPNVSKRKIRLPSFIMRRAWALIWLSLSGSLDVCAWAFPCPPMPNPAPTRIANPARTGTINGHAVLCFMGNSSLRIIDCSKWNSDLYDNHFEHSVRYRTEDREAHFRTVGPGEFIG